MFATLSSPPDGFHRRRPRHRPPACSGHAPTVKGALGIQGREGIGSTPTPATQPHPLVRTGPTTSTSKGNTMDGNKPQAATWVLCVDVDPDNPESDPMFIATLDMPLDGSLISVRPARQQTRRMHRACRQNRMPGHRQGAQTSPRTRRRQRHRGNARRPPHRPDG